LLVLLLLFILAGFVDPRDPGAGTKFLAPEKLRGVVGARQVCDTQRVMGDITLHSWYQSL
jgi:hypothetical protein